MSQKNRLHTDYTTNQKCVLSIKPSTPTSRQNEASGPHTSSVKHIFSKQKRWKREGETSSHKILAECAKRLFDLPALPDKTVMSYILNDSGLEEDSKENENLYRHNGGKNDKLECVTKV